MKWFQIKEKSANKIGLSVCWVLYNLLGTKPVKIIAFFMSVVTFILNKDLRIYMNNYFSVLYKYTNEKFHSPSLLNSFKNVLNYSYSLIDKMAVFGNKYNPQKIKFVNKDDEKLFIDDIKNKKGILFICNHIGNVEVMRALIKNEKYPNIPTVSIFMNKTHCKIFTDFVSNLSEPADNLKIYPIDDININDAINLQTDLDNGGIGFIAGDRISEFNPNSTYDITLLNRTVKVSKGVFKLAKSLSAEIYFISVISEDKGYNIYLEKCFDKETSIAIKNKFSKFLENIILKHPHQFYHFYDYFEN